MYVLTIKCLDCCSAIADTVGVKWMEQPHLLTRLPWQTGGLAEGVDGGLKRK